MKNVPTQSNYSNNITRGYGRCDSPVKPVNVNTNCGHTAGAIHYGRVIGSVWHKN